jgi:hypothetical protein
MSMTQSKNWMDSEIKGIMYIDGKKVIYLKPHAKRLWKYNDHLLEDEMDHLNKRLIAVERLQYFFKHILGTDEPENNS